MDRFIDKINPELFIRQINLKSNMDRFIVYYFFFCRSCQIYLKSNMDRFIAANEDEENAYFDNLKSNMDRFIG